MIKRTLGSIEKVIKKSPFVSCILVAAIVLVIDYITGKYILFPILYVFPVGLAAWLDRKGLAYTLAILLPLLRVVFHFPWNETQSLSAAGLNALIRIFILIFYAYLVNRISWQAKALKKKVVMLEGILPICSSCKRIRNEKGEYEQIEKYITQHSEASFSHGICKECSKKLYSEYLDDEDY